VGSQLQVTLDDGSERLVDHLLLGTGYRIDVSQYSFLAPAVVSRIKTADGFPQLTGAFESSVAGLHFVGAPAAWSYGPLMYFVSGTKYASRKLASHLSRNARKA